MTAAGQPPPSTFADFPEFADLSDLQVSKIVQNISRDSEDGFDKAADGAARKYLEAGLRLLKRQLDAPALNGARRSRPDHPIFRWLSGPQILREAQRFADESGDPDNPLTKATIGQFRDLWSPHRDYIADLLLCALASDHWSLRVASDVQLLAQLANEEDLIAAIHEVAYRDLQALGRAHGFRMMLLATALAETDELIRNALKQQWARLHEAWTEIYTQVLESRGIELREGFTAADIADVLNGQADGLAVRLILDPDAPVIDHVRRTSNLGTTAITLLLGAAKLSPSDNDSIEDHARRVLGSIQR